tara:strand:- start:6211 stop:7464 length:1254 start_codon:yes stop_codon:yes gene_type:complete
MCSAFGWGKNIDQVEHKIYKEMKKSLEDYQKTTRSIESERKPLIASFNKLEQSVIQLRQKLSEKQRLEEARQLSLQVLEQQLKTWKEQEQYIHHLLTEFKSDVSVHFIAQPQSLVSALDAFAKQLEPQWKEGVKVIHPTGEVVEGKGLDIGPLHWFLHPSYAGLVLQEQGKIGRLTTLFDAEQAQQLSMHQQGMTTNLPLDVTMKYAKKQQQQHSVLEHLQQGGFWIIPILCLGFFSLCITLFKLTELLRRPKTQSDILVQFMDKRIDRKQAEHQLTSHQKELLDIAIRYQDQSKEQREDLLHQKLLIIKAALERYLPFMTATAAVAPLLGLLGTVTGIMKTFSMMSIFGAGDENILSGGISQALITTEVGLVVAIPVMMLHAYLHQSIRRYLSSLEADCIVLNQINLGTHFDMKAV